MKNIAPDTDAESGSWVRADELDVGHCPSAARSGALSQEELALRARAGAAVLNDPARPCHQHLQFSFFFDGTGNNKTLDEPLNKSSNVARLHDAHQEKNSLGVIRIYIPGLGTPFPAIEDKGSVLGDALGRGGEGRLRYAMEQFDRHLSLAEARAHNPANKIVGIHVALFGFSRGAALARAFAVRLYQRMHRTDQGWALSGSQRHPVRLYFMGLFDTVASVGASNTLRNPEKTSIVRGTVTPTLPNLITGGKMADVVEWVWLNNDTLKGHNAWAAELRIPPCVEKCLHFVAAHEVRESFPLDTVRVVERTSGTTSARYPSFCQEVVYPGVHSDVGGGYAPGEHGRSEALDEQLSQVPLLAMYREAKNAGVPLQALHLLPSKAKLLFQLSPTLAQRFDHYLQRVNAAGCVEKQAAQHLYWFYRWRKLRASDPSSPVVRQLESRRQAAQRRADELGREINDLVQRNARLPMYQQTVPLDTMRERDAYVQQARELEALLEQMKAQDRQFMEEGATLAQAHATQAGAAGRGTAARLSVHQQALLEAWRAPPLDDTHVVALFDQQVHDSVADFRAGGAKLVDNSRITRPREVFQGKAPWVV